MPPKLVPGTSLFVTIFITAMVVVGHALQFKTIDFVLVLTLISGSIIGSGTISNVSKNKEPELQVSEGGRGYCCLVEKRMVEFLKFGKPITPYLKNGDTITIEIFNDENQSDFGRIQQKIVKL